MLLNRASQYAIKALVLLALQPKNATLMCRDLADTLHLPYPYLSKLMQQCVRRGLVGANRGRSGGYWLEESVAGMTMLDVVEAVNGERHTRECLLGLTECADENACVMHCEWKPLKEGLLALLKDQTLGELADAVRSGRCQLNDLVLN